MASDPEMLDLVRRVKGRTATPADIALLQQARAERLAQGGDTSVIDELLAQIDWTAQPEAGGLTGDVMDAPNVIGPAISSNPILSHQGAVEAPVDNPWDTLGPEIVTGQLGGNTDKPRTVTVEPASVATRVNATQDAATTEDLAMGAANTRIGGAASSGLLENAPAADPTRSLPPDRGGKRDRAKEHRGEDWPAQERAIAGSVTNGNPGGAFGSISDVMLDDVMNNPDVAAQIFAEAHGGNQITASEFQPLLEQGMTLASVGLLGNTKGQRLKGDEKRSLFNTGPESDRAKLQMTEDWIRQLQAPGAEPNAGALYHKALHRARNTPTDLMITEGQDPGSPAAQIDTTHAAVAAALATAPENKQRDVTILLNRASREYLKMLATGDPDVFDETGAPMSYPEYLRAIGAQRWLGGGR